MKRVFMILVLIFIFASYVLPGSGEVTSAAADDLPESRETNSYKSATLPAKSDPVSAVEGVLTDGDLALYRPMTVYAMKVTEHPVTVFVIFVGEIRNQSVVRGV